MIVLGCLTSSVVLSVQPKDSVVSGHAMLIALGSEQLSLEDVRSYMCDYLGFGQAEAEAFFKAHASEEESPLDFDRFRKRYASLNPFST